LAETNINYRVLIIDDMENNRKLLGSLVRKNRGYKVIMASNGIDILEMLDDKEFLLPDLILLDILMPDMNGFQLAEKLKARSDTRDIPIIFVTALADTENIVNAFNMGGVDYITKPYKKEELLARLDTHLELVTNRRILKEQNRLLESKKELLTAMVEEKTQHIEKLTFSMVCALENANLLNDTDTGTHIKRVSSYSELLARESGCDKDFVRKIKMYASLHDVGKVGIPEKILKKSEYYTKDEFEQMKNHVRYAAEMLKGEGVDPMALNIAVYHHEKWDGTGYLEGLKGEAIPLEARIVALADVYDALTTRRPYKDAYTEEKADSIILKYESRHFDPRLVKVFLSVKDKILKLKELIS